MKRIIQTALLAVCLVAVGWGAYQAALPPAPSLSRYVPPGALLYLQAKDFSSLLSDWDKSSEKASWVKSKNYGVFSQSRLLLRLQEAGEQFSKAAGLPADDLILHQVAGKQSALALYDIGKLEFLYVTRISSASAAQSPLWQSRSQFETRTAAGVNFFYRADAESGREVAFAQTGDYLLLATRQDLMAGALQLIANNGSGHSIEEEAWWQRPVAASGVPGDLRMILNLEKIVPTPYFRSYWIQRNVTDMKQYSSAISDLTRSGSEYREERLLFKKTAASQDASANQDSAAVADLLRFVPQNTGVYEAKANPAPKDSLNLLTVKILAPHLGPAGVQKLAPQVSLGSGETGSISDLETRIEEAPSQNPASSENQKGLETILSQHKVLAQLQFQETQRDSAGVFVRIHSVIAFSSEANWNEQEVRAALSDFVRPGLTSGELGVSWKSASGYGVLDGLWSLAVAVRGKYLIISDDPALLSAILANLNQKQSASSAAYAAGFSHQSERENFASLAKFLSVGAQSYGSPDFFSENVASLSFALENVASQKILVRDAADRQTQTVTYEWAR
ncbi:MAG: hypothetical protein JSS69_13045 [Acidobacteria bacterium]|nr:hypothetical protein [Acidobacteriota bacterium]MBS1866834.1 hypothetical protein [Acidobacteriota bacterium]